MLSDMSAHFSQNDVTGTVNLCDAGAVADAVCAVLARCYPDFDETPLRQGFADIDDAFWGRYPGLLACDTPYHDLRHFLDTALLMARMVHGFEITHAAHGAGLGAEQGSLAVLLALFHDIGFIRLESEAHINGASLTHDHERRSVDFMREYLARGPFAHRAGQSELIHATDFANPISQSLAGFPDNLVLIGKLLGTADLVSQISGRYYLENCRDALFHEFVIAGTDRMVSPTGETLVLYPTADDLLRKTPGFYKHLVKKRLDEDFDQVYRYVAAHFGGPDPYALGTQRNMSHLRQLIARNDFSSLRRKPVPMLPVAH